MTIQYKNATKSLGDTNLNTVLTISTSAVAIVKSVYFSNSSSGSILCNASLRDSSASADTEFFRDTVTASTQINAAPQGLNLEAGDAIKAQAATASKVTVVVSYALINRENENG
tara:strand:+ start:985 stop:1326 length:342 start_codon:yes stop_codon:yes gene_type:complete